MKLQCKFCAKRMEPRIEIEKRLTTADEKTYYCSLCGKQLLVLGGFWGKPSLFNWILLPETWNVIHIWETTKTAFKERDFWKFLFGGGGFLLIGLILFLLHVLVCAI